MAIEAAPGTPARAEPARPALVRAAAPLRQQVVDEIRRTILDGRYAPGDRLIERVLCEDLQVSRTVVREALRQLESEHLIELVPNVGPIVRELTAEEVRSLYEVRAVLESLAAQEAVLRGGSTVARLLDEAMKTIEQTDSADIDGLLRAKDAFIGVLIDGSQNTVVGDMLTSIHARVSQLRAVTLRTPGRLPQTVAELRSILDAAKAGDAASAAAAARRHVESAATIALDGFASRA